MSTKGMVLPQSSSRPLALSPGLAFRRIGLAAEVQVALHHVPAVPNVLGHHEGPVPTGHFTSDRPLAFIARCA